jgi:hypothetical protein
MTFPQESTAPTKLGHLDRNEQAREGTANRTHSESLSKGIEGGFQKCVKLKRHFAGIMEVFLKLRANLASMLGAMTIWIYGLFDGDKCRYVGQTHQPSDRIGAHYRKYPQLEFALLTPCDWNDRNMVEKQFIRCFRSSGQCDLNLEVGERPDLRGPKASDRARLAQANRKRNQDTKGAK